MMNNPLKTLEPNLQGRDFVIGDLHGCFDAFQNLLKNISFDNTRDRMISVGDLVDRGPNSLECLELLREPWFHSVLGNHEQMMLETLHRPGYSSDWFMNGGNWGRSALNCKANPHLIPSDLDVALLDLQPLAAELPYLITVNMKNGKKFHILHAELPTLPVDLDDDILSNPDDVRKIATVQCREGDTFVWHRNIFYDLYGRDLSDRDKIIRSIRYKKNTTVFNAQLSHIITGHTTLQRPVTVVGQTNIDTGAWQSNWITIGGYSSGGIAPKKWAGLTCIELDTWIFYQATDKNFKEIEPFVVSNEDLNRN